MKLKSTPKQRAALQNVQASVDPDAIAQAAQAINDYHAANVQQAREQSEGIVALGDQVSQLYAALAQHTADLAAARMGGGARPAGRQDPQMAVLVDYARGVRASMSTDSNPDGGYLVPDVPEQTLGSILRNESPIRRLAAARTITSDAWRKHVWLGGAGSGWVAEKEARPETTMSQMAEVTIPVHEIYANPKLTQTLLDDSRVDIAAELLNEVGTVFGEQENVAFVNGNGHDKPKGFLAYDVALTKDATRPFGTIQYHKTGVAADFATTSATVSPVDVLKRLYYSMKVGYRRNATWLMSSETCDIVSRWKNSEGDYILQSADDGEPATLLGRPVELCEDMPAVEANAFPIAFADWQRAYVVVDRIGVRVLRDPFTQRPWVQFYTTKRVGGGLLDSNAIKLLKVVE